MKPDKPYSLIKGYWALWGVGSEGGYCKVSIRFYIRGLNYYYKVPGFLLKESIRIRGILGVKTGALYDDL